jgi:hypothetical protein
LRKGSKLLEKAELLKNLRENLEWFRDNFDYLKRDFDKQWVIVQNKAVIGNYSTYDEVLRKVKGDHSKKTAMIEFVDSEHIAMFF